MTLLQAAKRIARQHPQAVLPVPRQAANRPVGNPDRRRLRHQPPILPATQTAQRPRPQASVGGCPQRSHDLMAQPVAALAVAPAATRQTRHSATLGANPQRPLPIHEQGCDPPAGQLRRVAGVEHPEPHAIEADQALLRSQPQVPFARLREAGHGVLRQPILRPPGFTQVFRVARHWLRPQTRRQQPAAQPDPAQRLPHRPPDHAACGLPNHAVTVSRLPVRGQGGFRKNWANPSDAKRAIGRPLCSGSGGAGQLRSTACPGSQSGCRAGGTGGNEKLR